MSTHGQGQERLDDAAEHVVEPAAEVAHEHADDDAEQHAEQRRQRRDLEHVAGAGHDSRQHVATRLVGAEREVAARRQVRRGAEVERVVRGDALAEDGAHHPDPAR